jgi:hypothetical protein
MVPIRVHIQSMKKDNRELGKSFEPDPFDEGIDYTLSAMVGAACVITFIGGIGFLIGYWIAS